jgi:hypothetical protein
MHTRLLGAGDDAYDLAADTSELLANPVLGPLIRSALRLVAPELDPAEATPPLARDPLTGLPTLVPLPRLERLYFQCARALAALMRLVTSIYRAGSALPHPIQGGRCLRAICRPPCLHSS